MSPSIENVVCKHLATSYDLKENRAVVHKQIKTKKTKKTTIILAVILNGVTDVQGNENE